MKFQITLKDPDGCYDCMRQAAKESMPDNLSDNEVELLIDEREAKIHKIAAQWLRYGEYVTIEIDSVAGICVVLPNR